MASEYHLQYRQKAEDIIAEVKRNAEKQNKLYDKKLKELALSKDQLVKKLQYDKEAVNQEAEIIVNKEYYRLACHENLVVFLYLSRLICLGQDEEQALKKCCLLHEKEKHINHLLITAKKQLPALTFEDYLCCKSNVVLLENDENRENYPDEEYIRIRAWQTSKKESCVKLEFGRLRDNFKTSVKDEIFSRPFIQAEIKQLNYIFSETPGWDAQKLADELKKLRALQGIGMPEEPENFHNQFIVFLKGDDLVKNMNPTYFVKAAINIEEKRISGMPVFGLSLFMYYRWLRHIEKFKSDVFDRNESSFENIFVKTMKEGEAKKESGIESIKKKTGGKPLKGRKYGSFLNQEIERQRNKFTRLEYTSFFDLMEQKDLLKYRFIDECLRSLNIELPIEELRQTIILDETLNYLKEELYLLKHNPLQPAADQLVEDAMMLEIICHMAPDSTLINRFLDIKDLIKLQISNERIPLSFINGNANCLFPGVFDSVIENFQKVVGKLNADDKGFFINDFLRDIEYMENLNVFQCLKKHAFFVQIKHILRCELKSAQRMKIFHPVPSKKTKVKTKTKKHRLFNFGYNPGPRLLIPILKAMILQLNLLRNGSTIDELMTVFTCTDLSQINIKIYIGCQTNFFYYISKKLAPWLSSFSPAQIEKSGIFVTCNDEPMTANNLYNSKMILWEDSNFIDSIFDAKYE